MTDLDRVIHEPARLMLVALLAGVKEADFLWLQRESGLTKGNLSSHLARLEEAGYVAVQKGRGSPLPQPCRIALRYPLPKPFAQNAPVVARRLLGCQSVPDAC